MKQFVNVMVLLVAMGLILAGGVLSQVGDNNNWGWLLGTGSFFLIIAAAMSDEKNKA